MILIYWRKSILGRVLRILPRILWAFAAISRTILMTFRYPSLRVANGTTVPSSVFSAIRSLLYRVEKITHEDKDIIFPLVLYLSSARLWNESNSSSRTDGTYGRTDAYNRFLISSQICPQRNTGRLQHSRLPRSIFPSKHIHSGIQSLITFQRILEKAEGRTKFDGPNPMQPVVVSWESAIEKAIHEFFPANTFILGFSLKFSSKNFL